MNSVARHLTPKTLAATLLAMRSARKEIFLVVEGSSDIALYSNLLGLPRSNFVSCGGKEVLMSLFDLAPVRGLDGGTVFVRDRDVGSSLPVERANILLLRSDMYDIEMHLLSGRLFHRLLSEYLANRSDQHDTAQAFAKILGLAAVLGAFREYAYREAIPLKFREMDFNFIDGKTLNIDIIAMIKKVAARSGINVGDPRVLASELERMVGETGRPEEIASGKDVLRILHIALSRFYKCAAPAACSPEVLSKVLRIAAMPVDIEGMTLKVSLANWIARVPFTWNGNDLSVQAA